jgi:hypothetical protein
MQINLVRGSLCEGSLRMKGVLQHYNWLIMHMMHDGLKQR